MGWYEELQKALRTAGRQVKGNEHPVQTSASPRKDELSFTRNAQAKMKSWGISEKDVYDVYYHGTIVKTNMMVRKYNGYELGIWFFADQVTGKAIISSAWKRGRR